MKSLAFLAVLVALSAGAFAQRDVDSKSSWSIRERGYLGLGFGGLGLGSHPVYGRYFSIGLSPMAGYMLARNFSTGLGFEYQYTSYSDLKIRIHQYGWYPFLRYNIRNFFLQTDYDWYSIPQTINSSGDTERIILDRFFIGVGYVSSSPGSRSALNILASYDMLYTNTSSFSSPLSIRIFMTF